MSEVTAGSASLASVPRTAWRITQRRNAERRLAWRHVPANESGAIGRGHGRRGILGLGAMIVLSAIALAGTLAGRRAPTIDRREPITTLARGAVPTPRPAWIDVPRPVQIWSLQAPDLAGLPLVYLARRRADGGGREDVLHLGALGLERTALRLRLYRSRNAETPPPLYAAMARHAAETGLSIARSGLPETMPTRFGTFETTSLALTGLPATPAAMVPCRGFRLILTEPALVIGGVACGTPGAAAPSRDRLTCILDRLDLASGGDDRPLIEFVARTEPHRNPDCPGSALAPGALHAAWLDDKPATHRRTVRRR